MVNAQGKRAGDRSCYDGLFFRVMAFPVPLPDERVPTLF